jgi:hypothetical protein
MRSMKDSLMKNYFALEQRLTEAIKNIQIESLNKLLPFSSVLLNRIFFLYILAKKGKFLPEKHKKEDFIHLLASEPRLLLNLDQIPEMEREKYFSPDFQKVPQLFCALTNDPILQDVYFDLFDIDNTFWPELALFLEDVNFDLLSLDSSVLMVGDMRALSPTQFLFGDLFEMQCNRRETGSFYTPKEVAT